MIRPPPISPLFPYTPLSRSRQRLSDSHREVHVNNPAADECGIEDDSRQCWHVRHRFAVNRAARGRMPTGCWWREWQLRSEEHTSELQSQSNLVCRLLLEKKK